MNNVVIDKLMDSPTVKELGLSRDVVVSIMKTYSDLAIETLLENGSVDLGNGMNILVVQLLDRVHVLRGITYKSTRKFKLKMTLEEGVHDRIEKYYTDLQESVL